MTYLLLGGHPHTWCAPCTPNTACGTYTTHACGECCHTPAAMHPAPQMTHTVPVQTTPQMIPIEVKECPCIEGKECPCEAKPDTVKEAPVQMEAKPEMEQIEAKPEAPPPCEAKPDQPGCTPESIKEVIIVYFYSLKKD